MKYSLSIVLVGLGVILSATNSKAQTIDNSCAYSFSWGSGYDYFSFCVTNYGTLAKLESPKGVNHLDTTNPIEGYAWCDFDDYGRSMGDQTYIPGLGIGQPLSVSQPHGPGKLPIIFGDFGPDMSLTFTAIPAEKTVVMTFKLPRLIYDDKYQYAFGPLVRIAALRVDGSSSSNFANSASGSFGYNADGHGVLLTASFAGSGIGGGKYVNAGFGGVNDGVAAPYCTPLMQPPFFGQGTIFTSVRYLLQNPGTAVFHYKVY